MTLCQCVLIAAILNLHLCEVTQYVTAPLCCVVLGFVSSGFQKCILYFAFINNDLFLAFKPFLKLCEWALVDVVLKTCFHLSLYGLSLKKKKNSHGSFFPLQNSTFDCIPGGS